MKRIIALFLIILFPLYLSCSGNNQNSTNNSENPNRIIPPESSLMMDFTTLEETNKSYEAKQKCGHLDPDELECFIKAWGLVLWGTAICYGPFIIPITIYRILNTQIPTEISTDHIIWNYTYTFGSVTHNVTAQADFDPIEQVWEWSFEIDGFVWITGASKDDLSAGNWQFHEFPTGNAVIGVEWTRTSNTNGTVKFTNINESQTLKYGDFILYSRVDNDISVLFHDEQSWIPDPPPNGTDDGGKLLEVEVYWNIADKTGGIEVLVDESNVGIYQTCTWDPNE